MIATRAHAARKAVNGERQAHVLGESSRRLGQSASLPGFAVSLPPADERRRPATARQGHASSCASRLVSVPALATRQRRRSGCRKPALLGQRVAAGARESAVGEGLFARFLQRHQREAAESELATPAADHEPLQPTPPAGRVDLEVEAVAVTVPAGLGT